MEDYFSRILDLAWQLRHQLTRLIEHVFGYIDWIPEHHGFQFSPCYKRSLPATERYIRGEAPLLSVSNSTEDQTPNGLSEAIVVRKGLSSICQRFPSFLHDFRLGQQLAFHLRELCSAVASEIHAKLARFLHRFWTTLQGSSKDIGWLKRTKTLPCSVDGTDRFKELLYGIR
jgi:hypothetical protein